jgi:hypothetical protein
MASDGIGPFRIGIVTQCHGTIHVNTGLFQFDKVIVVELNHPDRFRQLYLIRNDLLSKPFPVCTLDPYLPPCTQ